MNEQKPQLPEIQRVNVLGVGVSVIDMKSALSFVRQSLAQRKRGYICVTGVHGIMEAQADSEFKIIQNRSLLTTPDGMPLVWAGKLRRLPIQRVYGPDFMLAVCGCSGKTGYRHFFFGGKPGVAPRLKQTMESRFPGLQVVGTYTPPFHSLTAVEEAELYRLVNATQPDFLWVGLSTPKQERFMAEYVNKLPAKIMVGVGAAFDIHIGAIKDSPTWIKNTGLQWLHRLFQEPKRLWRRYVINNPKFIYYFTLELLGFRKFPMLGIVDPQSLPISRTYSQQIANGND
jgi:N-acetylglucosaminyldiphosphoundecaprenol N-acetyl-beta-D-mannosaminyltransferase